MLNEFFNGSTPSGGDTADYIIQRSLRFNSEDSAYLSRTPSSAGNRRTWTWSGWVKRSGFANNKHTLFSAVTSNDCGIHFGTGDSIRVWNYSGSYTLQKVTTAVFRDPSAWYHIVVAVDTTDATAEDRCKVYVNGARQTSFSTNTIPSQNADLEINTTVAHGVGYSASYGYLDGYLADVHFIDGQALDPTDFGEYDDNNVWQPKRYGGTYGTNGFHLDFSDNSTAAALGTDTSGNGNTWTVNNLSVAAGAGNDSLLDSPTNYDDGTNVGGNYCTWNPLAKNTTANLSNGNLDYNASGSNKFVIGTIGVTSGKWYWEIENPGGYWSIGIAKAFGSAAPENTSFTDFWGIQWNGQKVSPPNVTQSYGYSGSICGVAFDADNGTLTFYGDGVNKGVAFTGLTDGPYFPGAATYNGTDSANFGQRPFAHTPPAGYLPLCATSLPDPTIADGSTAMDVVTYTGNGNIQAISGLGFSPDFVWIKNRGASFSHHLYDVVRGVSERLRSDRTDAADTAVPITSFDSAGFTLPTDITGAINQSSNTYVGWAWDGGTSTVSNPDGSITSNVRANPSAGFSIANYVGNNTAGATVGHGLNDAPRLILVKDRDSNPSWAVYHYELGATKFLRLDTTDAATTNSSRWNNTEPTGSVFTVGTASSTNGNNGNNYIAYCFAPVEGYSAFGSYQGNGSSDGPMVYTGFRPRWIMFKNTERSDSPWLIHDTARETENVMTNSLEPNTSDAEDTQTERNIDALSNGFKIRGTSVAHNNSAHEIIYAAFAEHPFKTARAR